MITELSVRGLGVFADCRVVLGPGLTALTGETGAGKSLVVGAIQLLLGGRADASIIRPGEAEAVVDGRFEDADGSETILTRVVPATGRSRAYVDGRPVTLAELTDRGSAMVELHGQHAQQQLLSSAEQRRVLDRFAGIDLEPLHAARRQVAEIDRALSALGGDPRARARECDLLAYQLAELDGAGLDDPDEDDELDALEDLLGDAVRHRDVGLAAAEELLGDDSLAHRLQSVVARVSGRAPYRAVAERLAASVVEVLDASHELRDVAESIEDDQERLAEIRTRRHLLAELRRKYGETLVEVIAEREAVRERLDELQSQDARAEALDSERRRAVAQLEEISREIASARREAAPRLAEAVQIRLRALALPSARVQIEVAGDGPADDVRVLFAANPGSEPAPLARVASGGELSRVTLAIRLELSDGPDTMVFDEVDAGIGGDTAWSIAEALDALTDAHQVLVVTHLAQVAAFARDHVRVTKRSDAASTTASTEMLDDAGRVEELARMLSGDAGGDIGRGHAAELLAAASRARLAS